MSKRNPNKIRESFGDRLFGGVNFLIVTLLMVVMLYPFYYCVILAFNDGFDAMRPGIYFWPRMFSIENFTVLFQDIGLIKASVISVARTVLGTAGAILVTTAFAYGMSKANLRFRNFYLIFVMIPMYFSGGLVPSYILLRDLGLLNNFLVYVVPGMFSVYYMLIFMASFRELPPALEESAMLDGANHITMYFRLILPLSKPVIAAVCVFLAVGHWNSWMDTMMYMPQAKGAWDTLAYKFAQTSQMVSYLEEQIRNNSGFQAQTAVGPTALSAQLAGMLVSTAPIMAIYPFFQKYFVHGVMIGAVKG